MVSFLYCSAVIRICIVENIVVVVIDMNKKFLSQGFVDHKFNLIENKR